MVAHHGQEALQEQILQGQALVQEETLQAKQ